MSRTIERKWRVGTMVLGAAALGLGWWLGCGSSDVDRAVLCDADCSGHGQCQVIDGAEQCSCDSGYQQYELLSCIPEGCTPECATSDGECTDSDSYRRCEMVSDCPTWVTGDCDSGEYCLGGGCFADEVVTCEAGASNGPVAEPVFVRNLNAGNTGWYASPAVFDLDDDGSMEVIGAFYDLVVWDDQGEELSRIQHDTTHQSRVYSSQAVVDLEGDGIVEVVVAAGGGSVAAYEWTGGQLVIKSGWPASTCIAGSCFENRTLATGDLDHDGSVEIIVSSTRSESPSGYEGTNPHVFVFEPDGTLRPGWPRYDTRTGVGTDLPGGADAFCYGHSGFGSYGLNAGVGNVDDDPELEVLITYDNHHIQVFNEDGTAVSTDPTYFLRRANPGECDDEPMSFGQFIRYVDPQVEEDHYNLHTGDWPGPGTAAWAQWTQSPPIVADVDGDGNNEVVAVCNAERDYGSGYVTVYDALWVLDGDHAAEGNRSGRRLPGWEELPRSGEPLPNSEGNPSNIVPAVVAVDIAGDERPEMISPAADGRVYAWSPDATELWSYDHTGGAARSAASEPVVADLNQDGRPEVIFATHGPDPSGDPVEVSHLHILSSSGAPLYDIVLPDQNHNGNGVGVLASPTVADIDGDGTLEILLLTLDHGIDVYNVPGSAPNCLLWPTGRANYRRDGAGPAAVP
ncbi:MAG: VCBS repeat-containing protein [Deltaproteobacteria bacterium]|jgi:hypothetical protein|nr:VCBS repeat-containing protein [Deltaproteobacteria bacterium]